MFGEGIFRSKWRHIRCAIAPCARRDAARILVSGMVIVLTAMTQLNAQTNSGNSLDAYSKAISQSAISERIKGMEQYLSMAGNGRLRMDALEVLIWDYTRLGNTAKGAQHAQELLALEPGNAVAVAALNQSTGAPGNAKAARDRVTQAKAALVQLERLRMPEGMLDANYQQLRRQTEAILDGQIGLAYVDEKQYRLARSYLREAVAAQPDNTQYVYGLATALLSGENRDEDDGFWYLARAVDLTRGTAWGAQLAEYARKEYHSQGGSEADWNTFLSVASSTAFRPSSTATVASTSTPTAASTSAKPSVAPAQPPSVTTPKVEARSETKDRGKSDKRKQAMAEQAAQEALMRDSSAVTPATPEPTAKVGNIGPNPPVSLGILIQTSLLTHDNRQVILSTLKELINNLRRGDELCILVFSDQLDFEQDLTANDELLEQAIRGLKPKPGRALLDGISFSAGHLKRIGKNPNRVLVVISDGRSDKLKEESLPLSAQITGVKIDCIGLKVEGESEKDLLQTLAYYSGGKAAFASNPGEFRAAAVQAAQNVGIQF